MICIQLFERPIAKFLFIYFLRYQYTPQKQAAAMWYVANILQRIFSSKPHTQCCLWRPVEKILNEITRSVKHSKN